MGCVIPPFIARFMILISAVQTQSIVEGKSRFVVINSNGQMYVWYKKIKKKFNRRVNSTSKKV